MVKYWMAEMVNMANGDATESDALARLDAALDRIARHRGTPLPAPSIDTAVVAARLDALIGQIRDALEMPPGSVALGR